MPWPLSPEPLGGPERPAGGWAGLSDIERQVATLVTRGAEQQGCRQEAVRLGPHRRLCYLEAHAPLSRKGQRPRSGLSLGDALLGSLWRPWQVLANLARMDVCG